MHDSEQRRRAGNRARPASARISVGRAASLSLTICKWAGGVLGDFAVPGAVCGVCVQLGRHAGAPRPCCPPHAADAGVFATKCGSRGGTHRVVQRHRAGALRGRSICCRHSLTSPRSRLCGGRLLLSPAGLCYWHVCGLLCNGFAHRETRRCESMKTSTWASACGRRRRMHTERLRLRYLVCTGTAGDDIRWQRLCACSGLGSTTSKGTDLWSRRAMLTSAQISWCHGRCIAHPPDCPLRLRRPW